MNEHYFVISATLTDGAVSFRIEDHDVGFSSNRPVWTGREWVSLTPALSEEDNIILSLLREKLGIEK